MMRRFRIASLTLCLVLFSCTQARPTPAGPSPGTPTESASAAASPTDPKAALGSPPKFDSGRAFEYVKEIVAFGPRPIGSQNHRKVEQFILSHLKGDSVEEDAFTIETTEGKFPVRNLIAKFPGTGSGIVVIASHYDTNYPLRDTPYVGANDGASSSALLLEIANQVRGKRREGNSVWLLWDDAEESMRLPWYDPESLYGVRHLVQKWQADGTIKNIRAFLLEDMIGDADLHIEREANSTPWLEDLIYQAATRLGYQSHFFERTSQIEDDHMPFVEHGVPSADVIDFEYGYNNVFWHTPQDTVDKLSPKSLEIVGTVTLEALQMLDQK